MSGVILPGGIEVREPSPDVQLLSRDLANIFKALLGIQQQLDILIRMEAGGAPVRSTWRRKLQQGDLLASSQAASEAAVEEEASDGE